MAKRSRTTRSRDTLSRDDAASMANAFKALADPTRLRLVSILLREERCVHDLCEVLGVEQSAVSHQLRVLRNQSIVRARKDGRHVFYSLDDAHIRDLFETALAHVSHG